MTATLPLKTRSDFAAWAVQQPNSFKLAKAIVYHWRRSNMHWPGDPVKWAVYSIDEWCGFSKLHRDQVKRALKLLEAHGLVERQRHRFAGTKVRAWLRPTQLALNFMGRPQEYVELAPIEAAPTGAPTAVDPAPFAPISAPTSAPISAPISAPTDYTSLPFKNKKEASTTSSTKGMEVTGKLEPGSKIKELQSSSLDEQDPPCPPADLHESFPEDDVDKALAAHSAKKQKALADKYPEIKGTHEKAVVHPSKKFPAWPTFSEPLRQQIYAKYRTCVDNWNNGKKGKLYLSSDINEAEWLKVSANIQKWKEE